MKRFKLILFIFVIVLMTLACALPQTNLVPTSITSNTPADNAQPTLPPEPVLNVPSVDGELAFASNRDGKWGIMVMNADGSNEINLTSKFGEYSYPAWSPDGQQIAMRIDTGTGNGIAIMDIQQSGTSLSGSQPKPINNVFSDAPNWSPDGNLLLFISSTDFGWDFLQYNRASGETSQLAGGSRSARDPKWSPDGQKIIFSDDIKNNGNADIYVINADGSGLTQLTNNAYYEGSPNWSPDGKKIVFSAHVTDNNDLYIMNLDGSGLTQLTNDPAGEMDAAWSPDGTRIAFTSTHDENNDGNYEIYVIKADGSAQMRLTNNQSTDRWPTWRPGSTAIGQQACSSQATFSADISIPAGTRFTKSTDFTKVWRLENTGLCTWTPNSFRLRFVGGDLLNAKAAIPVPGAIQPGSSVDMAVLFTSPATPGTYVSNWQLLDAAGYPVQDSTGKPMNLNVSIEVLAEGINALPAPLYYLSGSPDGQIWRMEMDGRSTKQLTQEPGGVSTFEINLLDNKLAYISNYQLVLLDPASGNRQVLASGDENLSPHNPVFSSDGKTLAYGLAGIHFYNLATGEDRVVLADNPTMSPSERRAYSPRAWSPDDAKLAVSIGYWEWGGAGIISTSDGSLLSEFENADSQAWSIDSLIFFSAHATEPGMISSTPGLFSIAASAGAKQQTLVTDSFTWWPRQTPNGRLLYFQGLPDTKTPNQYNISLIATDADGVSNKQILRNDLLHLSASGFPEAVWSPDGYFLAAHLFHLPSKTNEIVLIGLGDTPMVYLMQTATNLRFGK